MSGMSTRPGDRRHLAPLGILIVVLFLLAGTGMAVAGGTHKPKLKISVPASVAKAGTIKIVASGYAGKFDTLRIFPAVVAPCNSTALAESAQQHASYGVKKNHSFKDTASISLLRLDTDTPGTHYVCVYLFRGVDSGGSQLYRSATYQITS